MNIFSMHKDMVSQHWTSDKILTYYVIMITISGIIIGSIAGIFLKNIIVGLSIGAFAGLFIGIVYGMKKSDV